MRVIFLGAPGAGKGTQAATAAEELGYAHISSGDLFRDEQARGTELGLLAKQYMEKGELVPNEVTIRMILGRIQRPDCASGYILDGFPRNLDQARALDEALEKAGAGPIDRVVYFEVSNEELAKRMLGRGRPDDTEDTIRNRLRVYDEQTSPLIDYYGRTGKLVEVNGQQEIEAVGRDLRNVLQ